MDESIYFAFKQNRRVWGKGLSRREGLKLDFNPLFLLADKFHGLWQSANPRNGDADFSVTGFDLERDAFSAVGVTVNNSGVFRVPTWEFRFCLALQPVMVRLEIYF